MSLHNISDKDLLKATDALVQREREILGDILHHLREVERRRLFSELGYKSLFDYAVKRLKYADDQAARRISAMRLLKDLPEIEDAIESGALTLTNLSMAQTLFRQEAKADASMNRSQKLEILARIENKSKREAERILVSAASDPMTLTGDRFRPVTEDLTEVKFLANTALLEKIEKVKGLLAHAKGDLNLAQTIDALCDLAVQKLDPATKPATIRQTATARSASEQFSGAQRAKSHAPALALKRRIATSDRRKVWHKAGSRCENCGSQHALQVDHKKPRGKGGSHSPENLRLLCRSCNQRAAIVQFGVHKMQTFLETR